MDRKSWKNPALSADFDAAVVLVGIVTCGVGVCPEIPSPARVVLDARFRTVKAVRR